MTLALSAALGLGACAPATAQTTAPCENAPLLNLVSGSSAVPTACTLTPGTVLVETLYYQNASFVGGTALAAYPMLQVSAGVARSLDVVVDAPSQVAESGLRGAGVYPRSHAGYGLRYRLSDTGRIAAVADFTVVPPASLYAPSETQPKYRVDVTSAYRLTPSVTVKGISQVATSHTDGFGRISPSNAFGVDLLLNPATVFSSDIGVRGVAPRVRAQSFGDVSLKRALAGRVAVNVGLGTTFNPVDQSKAHYLSAGLSFRP